MNNAIARNIILSSESTNPHSEVAMRRGLFVGIDSYISFPKLSAPVDDVDTLVKLFERHDDGSPNFFCKKLVSRDNRLVSRAALNRAWSELFNDFDGEIVFYFSGHGETTSIGGFLCTQDGVPDDPGLSMNSIVTLANRSKAREVLLIFDCCHAGFAGDSPYTADSHHLAVLRDGVTILAASRPKQLAFEAMGQGVFTKLLANALEGGAADVRGHVTAVRMYAHAEQILGPWDQRPMYKSHTTQLSTVRRCKPRVSDEVLRRLLQHFASTDTRIRLDPSYEVTHPSNVADHVALFNDLKALRNGGLIETDGGKDLFYVALENLTVGLSPHGKFYWETVKAGKI